MALLVLGLCLCLARRRRRQRLRDIEMLPPGVAPLLPWQRRSNGTWPEGKACFIALEPTF